MSIYEEPRPVTQHEAPPYVTFSQEIFERVKNGSPLYLRNAAHGDNLIRVFAYRWAIQKFMREKGEDVALEDINLQLFNENPPSGESDLVLKAWEAAHSLGYGTGTPVTPDNYYGDHLRLICAALRVKYTPEDLYASPLPTKTNIGPLKDFERNKVVESSHAWGEKARQNGCNEIVVLVQGGSSPEKRFSDQQMVDLIKATKAKKPNAYIVVVSDRDMVPDTVSTPQEDKSTENINLDEASKPKVTDTKNSLANPFATLANETIAASDINTVGAVGIAANTTITTDTFLAWYISGCQHLPGALTLPERKFLVLYTLGNKNYFGIPDSTPVSSIQLDRTIPLIPPQHYNFLQGMGNKHGISDRDIKLLKSAIKNM